MSNEAEVIETERAVHAEMVRNVPKLENNKTSDNKERGGRMRKREERVGKGG
jgi:hypothetical protein